MNAKVSIIIPCYNGEAVVNRAITSVFDQDYGNVELIVVNDGSTDNSAEVICAWRDRFAEKGWILKYVYQENRGLGGAINTGLKHVTGEYLLLLDADDEFLPGAISLRAEFLDNHPEYDVVRSNGWVVKGEHRRLFVCNEAEKKCDNVFLAFLRGETNNWAGGYMVRTAPLFAFYPEREIYTSRYGQNLQLLLPLTYQKPCGFLDVPLMNYIQQDNSLSQTADLQKAEKKDLENAAGYRDIRVHMLNLIENDPDEKNILLKHIDGAYWRRVMSIADMFDDTKLMKEAFLKKNEAERPSFEDRLMLYRRTAPIKAFSLRFLRKVKKMVGGT